MKGPIKITRVSVCLRPRKCCCNADPQEHPAALSSECHCPMNHGKWPHCSLARSLFNNVRCDFAQAACVDSVYHLCQTLAQILCFTSNPARGQRFRYRSLKRFISKTSSSALEVSAATVDHAVERIGGWELWTFFSCNCAYKHPDNMKKSTVWVRATLEMARFAGRHPSTICPKFCTLFFPSKEVRHKGMEQSKRREEERGE